MTRILFLNDHTTMGGAEKSLVLLADNLDPDLFDSIALVDPENIRLIEALEEKGVRYLTMPYVYGNPLLSVPRILRNLLSLNRIVKRYSIDVLYSNTVRCVKFASLYKLLFLSGINSVWHVRDMGAQWRPVDRLITPFLTDRLITVSRAVGEYHKKVFPLYRGLDRKMAVVYNAADPGSDYDEAEFERYRRDFGLDGYRVVLCAGRIVSLKGYEYVIEAMREVVKRHEKSRLLLVGEGSGLAGEQRYSKGLQESALEYELKDRVIFTGFVENIQDLLPAADVVVVPSVRNDSCPRIVIEAMAGGKPVIGTDVGGIPELITDGGNGFLVQPRSSSQIAERIVKILSDDDLRKRMGDNARRTAIERFSLPEQARSVERLLLEL